MLGIWVPGKPGQLKDDSLGTAFLSIIVSIRSTWPARSGLAEMRQRYQPGNMRRRHAGAALDAITCTRNAGTDGSARSSNIWFRRLLKSFVTGPRLLLG